jgi:RNA polymerase sigma factor (TIGR02999 family)
MNQATGDENSQASGLATAERGDAAAAAGLFAGLYGELHRLAKRQLNANAGAGLTISATTLLHEAYLNIHGCDAAFPDRGRFFAYAARAMRGLIIDFMRERRALKRGGEFHLTSLDTAACDEVAQPHEFLPLSEAIDELAAIDPELAELVDLKFFCGFSFIEIAKMRNASDRTVQRDWRRARLYLDRALRQD